MINTRFESLTTKWETCENSQLDCEEGDKHCSKEGKGKLLWKKVRYQLVEYHSLPTFLKDNEYILGHYRAEWPLKHILLSIFTIHNETLNVWTHLIGFFLFLALTIYTATRVPRVMDFQSLQHLPDLQTIRSELLNCLPSLPNLPDFRRLGSDIKASLASVDALVSLPGWHILELLSNCLPEQFSHANQTDDCVLHGVKNDVVSLIGPLMHQPITRWPFFAFLGGAMFCLLASSTCHLLACHSERLSYIMLRIDYAGIAALISTSFYPLVYYSFMCHPFFCTLYLGTITTLGVATIIFSLLPSFQKSEFRTVRASLFFGMGVSSVAPMIHKLVIYWDEPMALETTGYEILMGLFYGLGALIYATRIPERWRPGKFDIAGHSHQIFHVLVVAGAYTHYRAGLVYLNWRDMKGC